jgi:hypothetical protein
VSCDVWLTFVNAGGVILRLVYGLHLLQSLGEAFDLFLLCGQRILQRLHVRSRNGWRRGRWGGSVRGRRS